MSLYSGGALRQLVGLHGTVISWERLTNGRSFHNKTVLMPVSKKTVPQKAKAPEKKEIKSPLKEETVTSSSDSETYHRPEYEPTEFVIKEMMIQKGVSREKAIEILKNPTKHPEQQENFAKRS